MDPMPREWSIRGLSVAAARQIMERPRNHPSPGSRAALDSHGRREALAAGPNRRIGAMRVPDIWISLRTTSSIWLIARSCRADG